MKLSGKRPNIPKISGGFFYWEIYAGLKRNGVGCEC